MSFDNVSGSNVINSGSGGSAMNGTLNGTAAIVAGGKFGNALEITGSASSDGSVRIANAVVPLNVQAGKTWSTAMWIKTTTAGGTWAYQGDGGWGVGNTTFAMVVNNGAAGNNGHAAGGVRNSSGWQQGTTIVDDGNWHHIVLTFDGTTKVQYVDGVVDTWVANGWADSAATGTQFWIGGGGTGEGDGQVCLNGLIDEAYVFNRALSLADVQLLFNNNSVPVVPVTVTVAPTSGYRGQTFTVTATATPTVGTVTNAKVNLSALGLSSGATLVQSSANVFTNTFTIPVNTNALIGTDNVKVTVISTEPLIGSGGTTFTVVALPPTNAIILTQLTNASVYEYTEASFHFGTTNDAPNQAPFPMTYAWYTNSVLVSTNPMGPYYTFLTTPADNGMHIQAIARVADTNFSSIAVTSAPVTLTVNSGTPVYANGLKQEFFAGATRALAEIGNVGPGIISLVTNADSAGGFGDNHARRYSGYFIPPTTDRYVFFVASDDDCDVFLSTDSTPANKRLIAQEIGWSGTRNWQTAGGGGSVASQKRSDQWTPDTNNVPYAAGISLGAGQKYYLEYVMHNGNGGDNCGITYQTETEITAGGTEAADGVASRMTAASNNIAFVTWPGTSINWSLQPKTSVTVHEGQSTNFTAIAVNDAEMTPYYQWFLVSGGNLPGTPLTGLVVNGTNVNLSTIPRNYTGDQIYCVATMEVSGISTTSSVVNLTVLAAVTETGFLKLERWNTITSIATLESGVGVGTPDFSFAIPEFAGSIDNPSGHNNFVRRISGYFIPATSGGYKFYTTGDDDSDLFLSTDNTPGNKRLVAQEAGWNTGAQWDWDHVGGGGGIASQMNSSTWKTNNLGVAPYASGIALVAGQKYYIEQDWHQGGGGANNAATFALIGDPDPAVGTPTKFTGNVIAMSAVQSLSVAFTQQPSNTTVVPMGYATFSAPGTTDGTTPIASIYGYEENQGSNYLFYQWYKNGILITNANASTVTIGPLLPSDSGAQINCKMRSLGYADNALNPIWSNSLNATITVSPQAVFETGVAIINWWTNASLGNVESGSAGSPQFSYTTPKFEGPTGNTGQRGYATAMDGYFIPSINGNYIFFVNSDGPSDLFVSTDSNPANKRVVAKETGWTNPFQWTAIGGGGSVVTQKRSDQFTPDGGATYPGNPGGILGIPMVAGQMYYMQGVHQAGGGNDHIEVTYIVAGNADPALGSDSMLTGNLIGTYVPRIPWVAFLQQPTNQTVLSGTPVTFTAQGTNAPSVWIGTTGNPLNWMTNPRTVSAQYQWYKNGTPIAGATASSYTQNALPSDQNAQFVVGLRALGYVNDALTPIWSNSVAAVLTVVTDTVPPTISYAATFENTNTIPSQFIVNVTFSKWMNAASLSNATYTIAGATVTNVSVASNHRTVQLLLNQMPTLPLNITVNGVKDLTGNTIAPGSSVAINAEKLTFTDVGNPPYYPDYFGVSGYDPSYPSIIFIEGNGGYLVSAEGSDIWNAADGFNFGWELKTNDFDVAVRQVSNGHTSNYAKGGLMIREDLTASSREWCIINDPASADGIQAPDNSGFGQNDVESIMRSTNGSASVSWDQIGRTNVPAYPNAWLRLKRTGSVLTSFLSTDGVSWKQAGTYDTSLANTNSQGPLTNVVHVGICTTAHNNDYYTSYPPPPPVYYNTVEYANYNSSYVASTPSAHLTVSLSGSNVIVSWTPTGGHLEASPALSGPGVNWQTVTSSNPATNAIGSGAQFFRVVNP
jgi:hypothetical protein